MPDGVPAGLSDAFAADAGKVAQWRAFVNKIKLDAVPLDAVVQALRSAFQRLKVLWRAADGQSVLAIMGGMNGVP
jgi:hypothetical protein